jgi:hypothetical protein
MKHFKGIHAKWTSFHLFNIINKYLLKKQLKTKRPVYYKMNDCFGELPKIHKKNTKYNWKNRGLIMDNFEQIYERYITSTNCEKCKNPYKNRPDRNMDHSHDTNEFRNILCNPCNGRTDLTKSIANTSGHANICTFFYKISGHEYWRIDIRHKKKQYVKQFNKKNYSIEEVVLYRDAMYEDLGIESFD